MAACCYCMRNTHLLRDIFLMALIIFFREDTGAFMHAILFL